MGEVVRMFNGGAGEWCLASQEEEQIAEVGISENDTTNKVVKERGCAMTTDHFCKNCVFIAPLSCSDNITAI